MCFIAGDKIKRPRETMHYSPVNNKKNSRQPSCEHATFGQPKTANVLWISNFRKLIKYFSHHDTSVAESSRGRVVKATDSKSVGIFPRRFESCRLREKVVVVWDNISTLSWNFVNISNPYFQRLWNSTPYYIMVIGKKIQLLYNLISWKF